MSSNGYPCPNCGNWVYGTGHVCPNPFPGMNPMNQPSHLTLPPCRAPWMPLTADMVRLIIREELERRFPVSAGEKP